MFTPPGTSAGVPCSSGTGRIWGRRAGRGACGGELALEVQRHWLRFAICLRLGNWVRLVIFQFWDGCADDLVNDGFGDVGLDLFAERGGGSLRAPEFLEGIEGSVPGAPGTGGETVDSGQDLTGPRAKVGGHGVPEIAFGLLRGVNQDCAFDAFEEPEFPLGAGYLEDEELLGGAFRCEFIFDRLHERVEFLAALVREGRECGGCDVGCHRDSSLYRRG